jgi:transcriptional regulator with XRE-family HTH domain
MTDPVGSLESPSGLVAERIKDERRRAGLSTKTLAERCASLGAPQMTAAVLMNIESGRKDQNGKRRRDITVDELLVLAYALGVSPLGLLLPDDENRLYQITPTIAEMAAKVGRWLIGLKPPPLWTSDVEDPEARQVHPGVNPRFWSAIPAYLQTDPDERIKRVVEQVLKSAGKSEQEPRDEVGSDNGEPEDQNNPGR